MLEPKVLMVHHTFVSSGDKQLSDDIRLAKKSTRGTNRKVGEITELSVGQTTEW